MALSKKLVYPNGTETNYHKIVEVVVRARDEHTEAEVTYKTSDYLVCVYVNSYTSDTIRSTGIRNYVVQRMYNFSVSTSVMHNNCIMHLSYDLLKTLPEFADAEDV